MFMIFVLIVSAFQSICVAVSTKERYVVGYTYALLANGTYWDSSSSTTFCSFKKVRTVVTPDDHQMVVYQGANKTVLAFRGLTEEEELFDTINLDLVPLFSSQSQLGPLVTEGFRNWALDFENIILSLKPSIENTELIIVGHSAGAAAAYVLTAYMSSRYEWFREQLTQVVTFGSPRPGDEAFSKYWQSNVGAKLLLDYRFVMYGRQFFIRTTDPVASVPPGDNYSQPNIATEIKCLNPKGTCSIRDLHRMKLYLYTLSKLSNKECIV